MHSWAIELLACPSDHRRLTQHGDHLLCELGHRYPIVNGVAVLLADSRAVTPPRTAPVSNGGQVDPWVERNIIGTGGNLYRGARGLSRYPIPELPIGVPADGVVLDIGCSWGRWSFAAARAGGRSLGIDVADGGIYAARRIADQLQLDAEFVIADARALPVATSAIDTAFSYSMLQHLSIEDAHRVAAQVGRILKPGGTCTIQVAGRFGVRSMMQQARRGFRHPRADEVRYWSPGAIRRCFEAAVGPSTVEAEGFLSLNARREDLDLLRWPERAVVRLSDGLTAAARLMPALATVADSVWVKSQRL